MKHKFKTAVNFSNGAHGEIAIPELRWCDLENHLFYMGVRNYLILEVDDKKYRGKETDISVDCEDGKEVLILDENFFLSDLAKVWDCKLKR